MRAYPRLLQHDGGFLHDPVCGTFWGNYSLDDGCLERVRYTGKPLIPMLRIKRLRS